jgi:hypothetical protein
MNRPEVYRLVDVGNGRRTFPRLYRSLQAAEDAAEHMLAGLVDRPHRLPYQVDIIDAWTFERVKSVRADVGRPWDPDPFADGVQQESLPLPPSGGGTPVSHAGGTSVPGPAENTGSSSQKPLGLPGPADDPSRLQVRPARRVVDE